MLALIAEILSREATWFRRCTPDAVAEEGVLVIRLRHVIPRFQPVYHAIPGRRPFKRRLPMELVFVLPPFLAREPVVDEEDSLNSEGYTSRIYMCCT